MAEDIKIAEVVLIQRLPRLTRVFDYTLPASLKTKPGDLVRVPFRKKMSNSVIVKIKRYTNIKTRLLAVDSLLVEHFVTNSQIKLSQQAAEHFGVSWSSTMLLCSPVLPNRRFTPLLINNSTTTKTSKKQNKPLTIIFEKKAEREQVVKSLAQKVIARQQQLLILVPELNYIESWFKILKSNYQVVTFTSEGTIKKQRQTWEEARNGKAQIIIGTRAALWLNFYNLGGIVIDYAENENYKQYDQNPRYNSLEIANWLAKLNAASLALLTPAPALTEWWQTQQKHNTWKKLSSLAHKVKLVDLAAERQSGNHSLISYELHEAIETRLSHSKQIYLYLNRRGCATTITCRDCGYTANCPTCERSLVWNEKQNQLNCYNCNIKQPIPLPCPKCHGVNLRYLGSGLEKLENEVKKTWPKIKTITLEGEINKEIKNKIAEAQIILGSRAAWRYLDFSKIDLIGAVLPDAELSLPEFRAAESTWQTMRFFITNDVNELIIQTYRPEHYVWQSLIKNDFNFFYQNELKERDKYQYPPFCNLIRFTTQAITEKEALTQARQIRIKIMNQINKNTTLVGPYRDYYKQVRGRFRFHLLLRYQSEFNPEKLWPVLPDDILIDRHPYNVLS
jgi:primosomal protein N' (replication factor Y)